MVCTGNEMAKKVILTPFYLNTTQLYKIVEHLARLDCRVRPVLDQVIEPLLYDTAVEF